MLNSHITESEIKRDISDTQKEIDDYSDELRVLERNPVENKVRIYFLGGRISQRKIFIKKLNDLLSSRCSTDKAGGEVEEMLAQEWRTDEDDPDDISDPSLSQF